MISVIVPFFNELENLPKLVAIFHTFEKEQAELDLEFVLVDDGSTDGGFEYLESVQKLSRLKLVRLSKNFGSHAALRAGILKAEGDCVVFYYADMQDPISLIKELHERMQEGVGSDIVWAYRNQRDVSSREKLFSKIYSKLMQRFALDKYPESGFDVVMFSQKVQQTLNRNIEANSSIFLQILSIGYKQANISYNRQAREKGKSKWTFKKKMKLLLDSFVSFSYFPLKLVSLMGVLFFLVGVFGSLFVIINYFVSGTAITGWSSIVTILCLGFGVTNISLGIVAEYLWRTFDVARNRDVFIISDFKEQKS